MPQEADQITLKKVAILGYGSQGRAHALNLREFGIDTLIGARPDGKSFQRANEEGFEVLPFDQAAEAADILMMLLPDEIHGKVYNDFIKEYRATMAAQLKLNQELGFFANNEIRDPREYLWKIFDDEEDDNKD